MRATSSATVVASMKSATDVSSINWRSVNLTPYLCSIAAATSMTDSVSRSLVSQRWSSNRSTGHLQDLGDQGAQPRQHGPVVTLRVHHRTHCTSSHQATSRRHSHMRVLVDTNHIETTCGGGDSNRRIR